MNEKLGIFQEIADGERQNKGFLKLITLISMSYYFI